MKFFGVVFATALTFSGDYIVDNSSVQQEGRSPSVVSLNIERSISSNFELLGSKSDDNDLYRAPAIIISED